MKPWEVEQTIRDIRRMSGSKTIKVGIDLTKTALDLLRYSLRDENPKIKRKDLKQKVERIVWELRPWTMRLSLKI